MNLGQESRKAIKPEGFLIYDHGPRDSCSVIALYAVFRTINPLNHVPFVFAETDKRIAVSGPS